VRKPNPWLLKRYRGGAITSPWRRRAQQCAQETACEFRVRRSKKGLAVSS